MSRGPAKAPAYWFEGPVPVHARLLAGIYRVVVSLRLRLYRFGLLRRKRVDIPVIVIGNLVAGGSGKTPMVIALVERLQRAGWTPGVATRGYGREDAKSPRWVDAATDPAMGGDEPVLIAARTGARVRADADRFAAARALHSAGCDIVVCDDGLQHYRLQRDIEIEVIDGRRRYGNGALLPAGPLREPAERGATCDFRVLNVGSGQFQAGFGEWPMRLVADTAIPLSGGRPQPLTSFEGKRVHAVAGIGDPERFFQTLRGADIAVVPHAFVDHHRYQQRELQFGSDLPVLMTEKDAVKCVGFDNQRLYSVPIRAELPEAFWVALLDRLAQVARPKPSTAR